MIKNVRILNYTLNGINHLHDEEEVLSASGPTIENIRLSMLEAKIVVVKWVPRDANKVAHKLAFHAKYSHLMKFLTQLC